jgi:hypothetical protein
LRDSHHNAVNLELIGLAACYPSTLRLSSVRSNAFVHFRFFLRDAERRVLGVSFVDSQSAESPNMKFPNAWNVPLDPTHIQRVKVASFVPGYHPDSLTLL